MRQEFDLHCHSVFSDGSSKISEIEDFCKRKNIAISLTDHNEIRGAVELLEKNNILSIPGIEILSQEGLEILVYFKDPNEMETYFKKQIEPFKSKCIISPLKNSVFNLIESAAHFDTFLSLPHPYGLAQQYVMRKMRRTSPELLEYIFTKMDAIEVYNGHVSAKQARLAENLRCIHKKKVTVGSDAHELKYLGFSSITFEIDSKSLPDIFLALKNNNYQSIRYMENRKRLYTISKFYFRNVLDYLRCIVSTTFAYLNDYTEKLVKSQ